MIEEHVVRKKPEDIGTRWKHYNELLEDWDRALEIMNNTQKYYEAPDDKARRGVLEVATTLLRKQLDIMVGYDRGIWSLRDAIDSIPRKIDENV